MHFFTNKTNFLSVFTYIFASLFYLPNLLFHLCTFFSWILVVTWFLKITKMSPKSLTKGFLKVLKRSSKSLPRTVWKFHDFSVTQILREIKFGDSRSAKSAILTHYSLWIMIYKTFSLFGRFHTSQSTKMIKNQNSWAPKCVKMTHFALLESPNLISGKI